MKIAIHHRKGSFSNSWVEYCNKNSLDYILINVFDTNIIEYLKKGNVSHFMWHVNHSSSKDLMVFDYVMNSLETIGVKCFPNFNTRWHFDDKIAQKYLLESIGAPLVPSYVFYEEQEALNQLKKIKYPIVAKLRRGAGATNVKLLKNKSEAFNYMRKMFSEGINPNTGTLGNLNQKIRLAKKVKEPIALIKKAIRFIKKNKNELRVNSNEKGYFYYQDFMLNNDFDTRVIVVGHKAVAFKRINRKGDFRASGSGKASFEDIDKEFVRIAFDTSRKLKSQSIAYDFIYDENKNPRIIEICFGFGTTISSTVPFYWDDNLVKHEGKINMQFEMMKNFLSS